MFLFKKPTFLAIVMLLTLNACGSDSGDDSEGDSGGGSDQTLTGVFIDSPVAGLEYSIGTLSGITNEAGEFKYPKDTTDKISFYIGNLVIGSATPASIVTPLDFGLDLSDVTDYQTLVLILLTLQTIDSDDDPSNGIVISDIARAYASSEFQTQAFIGDVIRDYALNTELSIFLPSVLGYLERVKGLSSYRGGVREAAIVHFNNQLSQLGAPYNSLPPVVIDMDFDQIPDATDTCPTIPNPGQLIEPACPSPDIYDYSWCSKQLMFCPGGSQVAQDPANSCQYCICSTPGVPTLPCPALEQLIQL